MTKARILADYVAGGTTAAEFDYMDGVTSNVQTQMDAKAPLASPTFTGTTTISGDLVPSTPLSHRNLIINGGMQISQRGGPWTTSSGGIYTLDRWRVYENTTGNLTISQDTSAPDGFSHSLKALVETVDASIGSAEQLKIQHKIEAYNTAHLNFGTSSAKDLVLSFWVKSSVTGTFGCAITNAAENRSYVKEYTISSANTWEKKTLTIAGDTSGTWVSGTNAASLHVIWSMGAGTDRENTANTWHGSIEHQTSSCTNLIETAGATWYLTGVQLELGSNATPFEHRSYGDELARCQRYYIKLDGENSSTLGILQADSVGTAQACYGPIPLPAVMRTHSYAFGYSDVSHFWLYSGTGSYTPNGTLGVQGRQNHIMRMYVSTVTPQSMTQGRAMEFGTTAAGYLTFDAEL